MTSHYLKNCWPDLPTHMCVTRGGKLLMAFCKYNSRTQICFAKLGEFQAMSFRGILFLQWQNITQQLTHFVLEIRIRGPVSLRLMTSQFKYIVTHTHAKIEDSKMHILRCMGSKFCMKFQRCPLKFHTKFWTHTPQDMHLYDVIMDTPSGHLHPQES